MGPWEHLTLRPDEQAKNPKVVQGTSLKSRPKLEPGLPDLPVFQIRTSVCFLKGRAAKGKGPY